jgi:hypothetical protein
MAMAGMVREIKTRAITAPPIMARNTMRPPPVLRPPRVRRQQHAKHRQHNKLRQSRRAMQEALQQRIAAAW